MAMAHMGVSKLLAEGLGPKAGGSIAQASTPEP